MPSSREHAARAYAALAAVCVVPRLAILLHERGSITATFTEKSDTFAQTFVQHGTFGFIPGEPSAYTQPLYGWFLIPVYWIFGRSWLSIGLAQIALAIVDRAARLRDRPPRARPARRSRRRRDRDAEPVPRLARRARQPRDRRPGLRRGARAADARRRRARPTKRLAFLLGVVTGLAMLGNTRLVFIPVLVRGYLVWRLPRTRATALIAALVLAGAAVAVAPWLVRNKANVGCWALTTDGRAHVEGEQRADVRAALVRAVDRRCRHAPAAPEGPELLHPEDACGVLREGRTGARSSIRTNASRCRSSSTGHSCSGSVTRATRRS